MFLSRVESLAEEIHEASSPNDIATRHGGHKVWAAEDRKPWLFLFIFGCWAASLVWFGPRLVNLVVSADGWTARFVLGYFALFTPIA